MTEPKRGPWAARRIRAQRRRNRSRPTRHTAAGVLAGELALDDVDRHLEDGLELAALERLRQVERVMEERGLRLQVRSHWDQHAAVPRQHVARGRSPGSTRPQWWGFAPE